MDANDIKYAGTETIESVVNMTNDALDGKANSVHEHSYAGSASAGGAALASQSMVGVTTAGSGSAYTAQVPGITSLTTGVGFIMIPHTASTSVRPTLDVNGLGAKNLVRMTTISAGSSSSGFTSSWLSSGAPVLVILYGNVWKVVGLPKVYANDLVNSVSIANGGTGATTAAEALTNLGAYSKAEVDALLESVGGTKIEYSTVDLVAGESPLAEGEVYLVYE